MIHKTLDNRALNDASSYRDYGLTYADILKSLMEKIFNEFEDLASRYEGQDIADAVIVLNRLASLESLDSKDPGV